MALHSWRSRVATLMCVGTLLGTGLTTSCVPEFVFPEGAMLDGMGGGGSGGSSPTVHCFNRLLDPGETDTDCGGLCEPCDAGDSCVISRDCKAPPVGDPSYVDCIDDICQLTCLGDRADCNLKSDDGCEADLLTSRDHCGACGAKCAPDNAVGVCMNGRCLIKTDAPNQGCDPNFADCNLDVADGCEVNLLTDVAHCGACEDAECSGENGSPSCVAGKCELECSLGFGDCDEERLNGCETNTSRSVQNCGDCGEACRTDGPGWSAHCVKGVCGQTECMDALGDCDGDGSCTDPLDTTSDCGACGITCSVSNGTPTCTNGGCAIESCNSSPGEQWRDCDDTFSTGCEVDTLASPRHCGGCSNTEGGDGVDCQAAVDSNHITVVSCTAGACEVEACESGWLDCDGDFENGCEVDGNSDALNCGACANQGGEVCAAKPNTKSVCASGSCDYSCTPGFADFNQDRYSDPSDGCESRELIVQNAGAWGSEDTGGSGPALVLQHTLEGAPGTQRLVLVGIVCRDTATSCTLTQATYAGVNLRLLNEVFLIDTAAKIYYALDADLPAAGTYDVVLNKDDSWGSISAEVLELSGAEQSVFYGGRAIATGSQNCGSGIDATAELSDLPPGSIVYAVGGGNHDTSGDCTAVNPLTLSACDDADYVVFGSGFSDNLQGDVSATIDFLGCHRSVLASVGVRPEANY